MWSAVNRKASAKESISFLSPFLTVFPNQLLVGSFVLYISSFVFCSRRSHTFLVTVVFPEPSIPSIVTKFPDIKK